MHFRREKILFEKDAHEDQNSIVASLFNCSDELDASCSIWKVALNR